MTTGMEEWVSDGAGVVSIPTLEAGGHVIRLKEAKEGVAFDVPALPAEKAVEVTLRMGK